MVLKKYQGEKRKMLEYSKITKNNEIKKIE